VFSFSFTKENSSHRNFSEALIQIELQPEHFLRAKNLAKKQGLPLQILFPDRTLMYPAVVENDVVIYAVITNFANPLEGGALATFSEIEKTYDLTNASLFYGNEKSFQQQATRNLSSYSSDVVLVTDWTKDRVLAFDAETGDLVDSMFIPTDSIALASPKQARKSPLGTITISDQITDLVQEFDAGVYRRPYAPAGGVNTSILDNIRGHNYRSNGNLVVTVASGANQNSVAEFDGDGNYLGNFIAAGAGGLSSPFDILFRRNDVLVTASSGSKVLRYDLDGNYLDVFSSLTSFPQQMLELSDSNVAVCYFSTPSGIRIFSPTGELLKYYSAVTGNRGVWQLASGNFLTTNASGIHEIDSSSGNLIRTIHASANLQYITLYHPTEVSVGEGRKLPKTFSLSQNYPNPFNPKTVIGFSLLATENVTLKIYDIFGKEVTTLIQNKRLGKGEHEAEFDGSKLNSGVYFYRFNAGKFSETKKLLLIK